MRKISRLICIAAIIYLSGMLLLTGCGFRTRSRPERVRVRAQEMPAETIVEEPKPAEYRIGIEDILDISVWGVAGLARKVMVRPDGKISFPLIGDIQAEGLTLPQLDKLITEKLSEYVRAPQVSVLMDKFGGNKVIVLGEVSSPGAYRYLGKGTIIDSIALAGGFTEDAILRSTQVIRGSLKDPQVISVNAERLFKRGDLAQNINLQPGDIIYVPKKFIANVNYWIRQITPSLGALLSYELLEDYRED